MKTAYGENHYHDTLPNLEEDMIEKLVRKISFQATQLASMEKASKNSAEYACICEGRARNLEVVRKTQSVTVDTAFGQCLTHAPPNVKNEHDITIQLKNAEECLINGRCRIVELEKELRSRERQWKLSESKVTELRNELQKTRVLLQSSQHSVRLSPKASGTIHSHGKLVAGLRSEISSLRAYLNSYQTRLESSKKTQRALALRVGALEDQIDNMLPSIKFTDLEIKALTMSEKLRAQNSNLRNDGTNSVTDISHVIGRQGDSDYDFEGPLFPSDSYHKEVSMVSCSDSHFEKVHQSPHTLTPERPVTAANTGEGEKSSTDSDGTKLRAALKERDVLLEFIQDDMVKSSHVSNELRKERKKMRELDSSFSQERDRFNATIAANRAASLPLDDSKLAATSKPFSSDSSPSRDLLVAQEGERVIERVDPEKGPQMRTLDPYSGMGRVPHSISNRKTWAGADRKDSLREDMDWQAERAALLEELQRLRPLGDAIADMALDFTTMQHAAASEAGALLPNSHQDAPSHRARPSTSTGNDPIALSYCEMYTLRVARKMESSRGHDAVQNTVKRCIAKGVVTADLPRSTVPKWHSTEPGLRCFLSGRHASWIALPSISRVSVPLCKKLRNLFGDLIDAENACSQLEIDLFSALDELERLGKCKGNDVDVDIDIDKKESSLAEVASSPLLEAMQQTTAAVCAVPGGWERFFDCSTQEHTTSSRVHVGGIKGTDKRNNFPSRDDSRTLLEDPATRHKSPHARPPPLHMIPVIVSRAIDMARAYSSEVSDKQLQLSAALSDLHDAQARLIAAVEYTDCLTTELAMREKKENCKAEAFICIESNLRNDLEQSNAIAHDRQLVIARLTAEVDLMQRRANDFVSRQGARSKEHRHTLLRDRGVQAEEGQQKPSPHHLRNRLSPHPDEAREMSVSEPFWMMEGNQEERRFPRKPASFRRNPLSPETPKQSERGPYLQATPEEEEEEEGEEGIGVGAGSGSRDPRWGDDGVCGTPDTEDSDLYCSDEEDRIEFTVGADKENADVVCDEDSRYSLERVFVNQYLSNSIVQPTHTSHLPVKASTSKIVGGRMTSTGDAGATDTSRSKNAQHHHRPSLNVSSGSVKSSADNKWRTRSQGTEDCHTMVTCLSEPTLRWENPAQQLDNQLRKARLTLASLRDTIKSDI